MPDSTYFKDWLDKANNDLLAAEAILAYYEEPPTDTVCYHCHQVAEKCFKAFAIAKATTLHKIHYLVELLDFCVAINKDFEKFRESAESLNRYYIDAKYPPALPILYPIEEAKAALDQAKEILAFTRSKLLEDQSQTSQ
jgi:HEPN domain-containing protein